MPGNRKGLAPEAYVNSTSQGEGTEDARLPAHRAYSSEKRTTISAVAVDVSWIKWAR